MYRLSRQAIADVVYLAIALVWAGMLIGVSFVATPIKFSAPSLTLPVALDVGRVTFHLFSRIEWALAATLLLASAAGTSYVRAALAVLLVALVTVQSAWLLPVLDARIAVVVAGATLPPSQHHTLYAIAEAVKLLLLAVAGSSSLSALAHSRR